MPWKMMCAVLALVPLTGCAGLGPGTDGGCAAFRPIYIGRADTLTEDTAGQLLAHNETGARLCGAKAEQQLDRLSDTNKKLYDALHEAVAKMGDGTTPSARPAAQPAPNPLPTRSQPAPNPLPTRSQPAPNPLPTRSQPAPNPRPASLFEFLASKGGIQDQQGELRALDLRRQFLPRQGALVRPGGMTLDRARELAEEAGYIRASDRADGFARTEITDLLNAMDREARGGKVYPIDEQADVAQQDLARRQVDEEATRRGDAEAGVREVLAEHHFDLPEGYRQQAVDAIMRGVDPEDAVVEAVERFALQAEARYNQEAGAASPIPFEDIVDAQQQGIQRRGNLAAQEGSQESAPVRAGPEGTGGSGEGHGWRGSDRDETRGGEEQVARASERTDQGEQLIVDGLRPVTARDRAEAAMAKPLQPKKRQKAADEGLFDVAGRGQKDLFSIEGRTNFIPAPNGSSDFGAIISEIGRTIGREAAPIRLLPGRHDASGQGFGKIHIEAEKERLAPYQRVEDFVASVARDFTEIRKGLGRRLLLIKRNGRAEVAVVELRLRTTAAITASSRAASTGRTPTRARRCSGRRTAIPPPLMPATKPFRTV